MIDIDAIERRANAATPGPWKHEGQEVRAAYHVAFCGEAATSQGATSARDCTRNARFIAHARTDVSALIARVRELETQLRIERENVVELEERLVLCQRTNDRMRERIGVKPPPWETKK